ncbi:UDP-glucose--hexose-1-phosphate uridylyltransferase [Enterococcus sp. BWM-S5]|uniref:UDP-glucose--hexose-1-phosphate uridylyltransferase n=1 Tax=Enterococcus larvae TaxID=2794352 RepID=A0ABS4CPW4_9ENTE|nr:UDP-glucose--hexose-1-phosphate uridylyltransferase [Enterococcus larvae]MBP1048176.1 UDP-glucose--hexose-1-phosphate uridylyltransferase [Enterococcus larvae]
MMKLNQVMDDFITIAIQSGGWMELDRLYLKNRLLTMIGGKTPDSDYETEYDSTSADSLSDSLVDYAVTQSNITDNRKEREYLKVQLLDLLAPPPSVVNAFFAQHYSKSPEEATDYFYELNKRSSYIKSPNMLKEYRYSTKYGNFLLRVVTDDWETEVSEQALIMKENDYPKCMYCFENEGLCEEGTLAVPGRRLIRMNVAGESWGFQFAQAEEYQEKFIISSEKHQSMTIDEPSIARMTQLLDIFPQYFICLAAEGRNDHGFYEGGREELPIAQAVIDQYIELKEFPLMNIGSLIWPFPAIRLQSPNAEDIPRGIAHVLSKWQQNFKTKIQISSVILGRKKENLYEFDLLLLSEEQKKVISYQGNVLLAQKEFEKLANTSELDQKKAADQVIDQHISLMKSWSPVENGQLLQENFETFLISLEQ